jgi:hypothetical protein
VARTFIRGTTKFKFLPAVASLDAPTRSEITAGKDLSPEIADIAGWEYSNTPIPTPDLGTTFDTEIGGPDKAPNSSVTLYDEDPDTAGLRAATAKDTAGFMCIMDYGDVATKRCEIWPCTVIAQSNQRKVSNEALKLMIQFSITSRPHQNAVIPT